MRYLITLVLAASAMVLTTGPAQADLGDQLFKLLADDGAPNDYFGFSVAITGETAIVGANYDVDNGVGSGSAYLFDTTTGRQLFKLLPNDGAADDRFGRSVAISGPPGMEVAIVGAYRDEDNGDRSGSAYLFDTTTGRQLFKLLPNDGALGDEFGWSVAISGTTVIVGALRDDDNGIQSGSAYLFDTTTGRQIAKLLPAAGAANDLFGISVAISGPPGNETIIVGAIGDDDNGPGSGSAYLFDATTGRQLFKLLADDGALGDEFGWSVAISGTTAIVGHRVSMTTATSPAPPTSSTPPPAGNSTSSSPTTARRRTSSVTSSRSAEPPPSSGHSTTTTTTATTPARPTSSTLPRASRSPSSCPTTVRRTTISARPSQSAVPPPSWGPTRTTTTVPTPAPPTSLMLPSPERAPGMSTAMAS